MRKTIIGIIIGIVIGVMAGATIVAPGIEKARHLPPAQAAQSRAQQDARQDKTDPDKAKPGERPKSEERLALEDAQDAPGPLQQELPSTRSARASTASGNTQRLRIVSLFPPKLPILGEMATRLEFGLANTSGDALNVKTYAPGTLVPAADTFHAVTSGTVEAAFASPGQWIPEEPAFQLFTAIPFGPGADEMLAWFYHGGGRDLFEEMFAKKGVHAVLCGAIPPEGSGWYVEPIRAPEDFTGLSIRAFGLSAKVLERMGAIIRPYDAAQVLTAFEERRLDGAEYSLPSVDAEMGFHKYARNYYFPGWQQPVTLFALGINAQVWNAMPTGTRSAINQSCGDNVRFALTRADALQFEALKELGLVGVQVRRWPEPVLGALEESWKSVLRDIMQSDAEFAKVWTSLQRFRRDYSIWRDLSRP